MAAHRDAGPGRGRQLIIRRYLAPRRRVSISMTMKPALHGLDHSSRIHNAETRVLVSRLRAMWPPKKPRFGGAFFCKLTTRLGGQTELRGVREGRPRVGRRHQGEGLNALLRATAVSVPGRFMAAQ